MGHYLRQLVWSGFELGDPEGDTTAIVHCMPPGYEAYFRAYFGGALPAWLEVMPPMSRPPVKPPSLRPGFRRPAGALPNGSERAMRAGASTLTQWPDLRRESFQT